MTQTKTVIGWQQKISIKDGGGYTMKIAALSRNKKLYSTARLVEAINNRGQSTVVIDVIRCYMNTTSHNSAFDFKGDKLECFNAVISRISALITFDGTSVVRQFEMMGVYSLNASPLAARIIGLNIDGVDILRSNHGPVVMEVNSSPGLKGIEETTGKDIAGNDEVAERVDIFAERVDAFNDLYQEEKRSS